MSSFRKQLDRVNITLAAIAAAFIAAATLILTWMVLVRSLGFQNSWELEASIELMIAATFLASPYTLSVGGHVKMDLIQHIVKPETARWLAVLTEGLAFIACAYIGYAAVQMTAHAYMTGERALGVWQPLAWPKYSTVAIGMLLTALEYLFEMAYLITGQTRR